jgi:hypothetical protein
MTKRIEGLRWRAYQRHISEATFNTVLAQSIESNPEPPPSLDLTEYFRWNALIVENVCEAFSL